MEGDMDAAAAIGATDIREVMKSQGPIVNTVILRCRPSTSDETNDNDKEDSKPSAIENTEEASETEGQEKPARVILKDLIDELKIDTTPSKSKVSEVLGGPFTFLGQYEEEGVVLMIRKFPDDLEADLKDIFEQEEEEGDFVFAEQLSKNFNIKALKAVCFQREIDTDNMTEKRELVEALVAYQKRLPAYNEHLLQPPLHKARVRGDIVVMKVAETEEELDDDDEPEKDDDAPKDGETTKDNGDNGEAGNEAQTDSKDSKTTNAAVAVPSNEEFFLDYSKESYIKFASRTDIPEHDIEEGEESDGEEEEADQEEEEEGESAEAAMAGVDNGDDDEEDVDEEDVNDEDKTAMFNLVMNEVLRQYREENGRGPNTAELLELRANIAKELGVEIAKEIDGDWDKMAKENTVPSAKKIAFTKKADQVREYVPDRNEYPSDDDDDEDYDDVEDSENVARSLMYEEDDDDNNVNEPPTKKLKTSEDAEGDSKPAAVST